MSCTHAVRLVDIAELNPTLVQTLRDDELVSFVPMSAVDAESARTVKPDERRYSEVSKGYTPFLNRDLLVAKITPCFENGKIAQAMLSHNVGFGATEFHVIRPLPHRADARYLLHYLRLERVRRDGERKMTGSAGQRRVPEYFLADLEIPLPDLAEQRRIAAILDKADELRAKRRAALAQLDTLTQAVFLDMFGDPIGQKWRMATVREIADPTEGSIRTGPFGSQLLHSEFTDSGIAVLGIDNAVAKVKEEFPGLDSLCYPRPAASSAAEAP